MVAIEDIEIAVHGSQDAAVVLGVMVKGAHNIVMAERIMLEWNG